jgi:hypothetical protein
LVADVILKSATNSLEPNRRGLQIHVSHAIWLKTIGS